MIQRRRTVWKAPAYMQMTLWRRLSRVRTSLTLQKMKAGLSELSVYGHFSSRFVFHHTTFCSKFCVFLQTVTWDYLSAKMGPSSSLECSALTGMLFYNGYLNLMASFYWPMIPLTSCLLFFRLLAVTPPRRWMIVFSGPAVWASQLVSSSWSPFVSLLGLEVFCLFCGTPIVALKEL